MKILKKKKAAAEQKGATSFINVKLNQITPFIGQETEIPVSRVWLKKIGFKLDAVQK